jgi:hypothetical protein
VDLGLVSGVNGAGFFRSKRQVAEALVGAVFAGAQGRVLGIDRAQGAAVTGKVKFNRCKGVLGAKQVNFALAEALQAFKSRVALRSFSFDQGVKGVGCALRRPRYGGAHSGPGAVGLECSLILSLGERGFLESSIDLAIDFFQEGLVIRKEQHEPDDRNEVMALVGD